MNIENIGVNKYPISQLFDSESRLVFEIPKYQREYVWGKTQWEQLFDDLIENENGYFLGSIICINSGMDIITEPKYEVVDGQQRLTTVSLLLVALYSILDAHRHKLDEEQSSDILQLKRKLVLKKTVSDIRVIPQVQNNNINDYLGVLAKTKVIAHYPMPKYAGNRRIVMAFEYFKKRIENELPKSDSPIQKLFEIVDKINSAFIVMITVSNHADAYTLFESLNNRGTPLTAVDLIKNLLLARIDATDRKHLDYYFNRWQELLEYLGNDYSVQERFFRQNYNAFRKTLNAPFIKDDKVYPLGNIATRTTMLDIYQRIIKNDPKLFLKMTLENASLYSSIILRKTDNVSEELIESYKDLQRIQGAPSYLLLLYLVKYKKELDIVETDIVKINKLLTSFFVRRNLTDTPPTRDLTTMFMSFVEDIEQNNYKSNEIFAKLRDKVISVSASRELFEDKLRGPVYTENTGATRFILCTIAQQGMTVEKHMDLWRRNKNKQYVWTIEHIFPQGKNIPDSWVTMISGGDVEIAKEYQNKYVHTFGNLTITGYNSALGNKSFEEKKERKDSNGNYIGYRNGLNLNAYVCEKEEWTIEMIQDRTNGMVNKILDLFEL